MAAWSSTPGQCRNSRSASALLALLVLLVSCLTVASARDPGLAASVAASPLRLAHGHVWLLVTSGLLAERPLGPSIISFAFLASLALVVCGSRAVWVAAALGHVGSTLVAYLVIALAWALNPSDLRGVIESRDYGVSAVSAAWLGAIAAAGWRARGQTVAGRLAIVISCLGVALFAYSLHPGLTFFASEHAIAFAVGVAVGAVWARPDWSVVRRIARQIGHVATKTAAFRPVLARLDPFVAVALLIVVALVGGSAMSNAVASLPRKLIEPNRISAASCVDAWNRAQARWSLPSPSRTTPVLIVAGHGRRGGGPAASRTPPVCSYLILLGRGPALLVQAHWRHGGIENTQLLELRGREELPTNATVSTSGRVQLDARRLPAGT
jgi:hypothetical protein